MLFKKKMCEKDNKRVIYDKKVFYFCKDIKLSTNETNMFAENHKHQ